MEFLDGEKVTDAALEMGEEQRTELISTVISAFAHQMFVEGVFNADPHPGNILVLSPALVPRTTQKASAASVTGVAGVVQAKGATAGSATSGEGGVLRSKSTAVPVRAVRSGAGHQVGGPSMSSPRSRSSPDQPTAGDGSLPSSTRKAFGGAEQGAGEGGGEVRGGGAGESGESKTGDGGGGSGGDRGRRGGAVVGLIDFGMTRLLGDDIRLAFSRLIVALSDKDFGGVTEAIKGMGIIFKGNECSREREREQKRSVAQLG